MLHHILLLFSARLRYLLLFTGPLLNSGQGGKDGSYWCSRSCMWGKLMVLLINDCSNELSKCDGILESRWVAAPVFSEGFYWIVCMNKCHPVVCDLIKLIRKGIATHRMFGVRRDLWRSSSVNSLVYSLLIKLMTDLKHIIITSPSVIHITNYLNLFLGLGRILLQILHKSFNCCYTNSRLRRNGPRPPEKLH